jgi:hypothetical protein
MEIRRYFNDYYKWFPEKWSWKLKDIEGNSQKYMKYRARKCSAYKDNDLYPFFDSIEKDANQFDMKNVEFTDIFGIVWCGKKGIHRSVGDADYDQHLYYIPNEDEYYEEGEVEVSDEWTQNKLPEGFDKNGCYDYIDIKNIKNLEYHWILENHLFKDSSVTITYDDTELKKDKRSYDYKNNKETICNHTAKDILPRPTDAKKVRCRICEKEFWSLYSHLHHSHNINKDKYTEMFPHDILEDPLITKWKVENVMKKVSNYQYGEE